MRVLAEIVQKGSIFLRFLLALGCVCFAINFIGSCNPILIGSEGGSRSRRVLTETDRGYHHRMMKNAGLGFLICLVTLGAAEATVRYLSQE
jgi:hypothetical protein